MDRLHRFVNLLSVATADGSLSEREIQFLSQRAREWGLSDHQFAIAVNRSLEHPGEFEIPRRRSEREELLRDMLRIMAADGRLQDVEKQLFAIVAAHMKFSAADIDAIIVDLASQVPSKPLPAEPSALPLPTKPPSAKSPSAKSASVKSASVKSASAKSAAAVPPTATPPAAKAKSSGAKIKKAGAKQSGATVARAVNTLMARTKSTKTKPTRNKAASKKSAKSQGGAVKPAKARKKDATVAASKKKGPRS